MITFNITKTYVLSVNLAIIIMFSLETHYASVCIVTFPILSVALGITDQIFETYVSKNV